MTQLNAKILHLEIPDKMKRLPIEERGFPVPWFVDYVNGKPDFRTMDGEKMGIAVRLKRCWMCGQPLGVHMTFVLGPMCCVTRTNGEPPSHRSCATFAARACPFLSQPRAKRNEKDMPEEASVAGIPIQRNPGVVAIWTTKSYAIRKVHNGVLFKVGDPEEVQWIAEGRTAKREEILHSIETGMPLLRKMDEHDPEAQAALDEQLAYVMTLVPA